MKKLLYGAVAMGVACFGVSCDFDPCGSTPEAFVTRADDFFEQTRAATYDASDNKWKVYDERLQELVEICYPQHEDELNRAQRREFWADVSDYYVQRYGKAGAREVLRKLKSRVDDLFDKVE